MRRINDLPVVRVYAEALSARRDAGAAIGKREYEAAQAILIAGAAGIVAAMFAAMRWLCGA